MTYWQEPPKPAPKYRWTGKPSAQYVMCVVCGEATPEDPDGRSRLYCSNKCKQKAYRARRR